MAENKRGGLTLPTNPALELQRLIENEGKETQQSQQSQKPQPRRPTAEEAPPQVTAKEPAQTTTQPTISTTGSAVVHTTGSTTDPLRDAMLAALAAPLPGDPAKGPFSVTSIKVQTDIWQRLGLVTQLTGRNRQDLVSEALLDLFAKAVRGEVESA